jgi:hypothetical protein
MTSLQTELWKAVDEVLKQNVESVQNVDLQQDLTKLEESWSAREMQGVRETHPSLHVLSHSCFNISSIPPLYT